MQMWFSQYHTSNVKLDVRIQEQLFSGQSDYQKIDVSVDSDKRCGKGKNICRAEGLLVLKDYRSVAEQKKQSRSEQHRIEYGTRYARYKILHKACFILRSNSLEDKRGQPAHKNSGHNADDCGAQGTDAEKRNAECAHSEALDKARYSEYRA